MYFIREQWMTRSILLLQTSPMQFTYRIFDCAPDPEKEAPSVVVEPSPKKARVEGVVTSEPDPPPPAPPAAPSVAPSQPKDPVETRPKAEPEKAAAASSSLLASSSSLLAAAAAAAALPSVKSSVVSSPSSLPTGANASPSAVATSLPAPATPLPAAAPCPVVPEKPVETKASAASFAPESIADDFNEDDDDDDEFTLRISSSEEEEQQPEPAPEPEPVTEPQPEPEPEPDPVPESEPVLTVLRGGVDDDAEGRRSKSDAGRSKARQKEERKRSKHKSKHHQRGEDGVKKRKTHRGDVAVTPTILQYDEDAIKLKVKLSSPTSPSSASSSTSSNHHKHHHHHHHSKHHHSKHHKQSEVPANGEPAPAERERLAPRPKGDRGDVLLPPSSITVSKVDPADRRKGETKRPALEITLVNAPKKACPAAATSTTSNATSALRPPAGLTITPKIQPPKKDEHAMKHDDIGALDLSGKSSRTHSTATPESTAAPAAKTTQQSILSIAHTLVHRQLQGMAMAGQNGSNAPATPALSNLKTLSDAAVHIRNMMAAQGKANGCVGPRPPASRSPFGPLLPAAPSSPIRIPVPPKTAPRAHELYSKPKPGPGPNQAVRHIPNPSALVFRQQPYQASSIRKMENMTRNIEKVAAGLQMRAVEANVTK